MPTSPLTGIKTDRPGGREFAPLRFSTDEFAERDRLAKLREEFCRKIVRVDIEPLSDVPFRAEVTLRSLPQLRMVTVSGSPIRFERTAALTADCDEAVALIVNERRTVTVANRGREVVLGRGEAVFIGHHDHAVVSSWGGFAGVVIPLDVLASRVSGLDGAIMRPIRRGSGPVRLLTSYLRLLNDRNLATPQLRQSVASHIQDLAVLALSDNGETSGHAGNKVTRECRLGGGAAARIAAARAHIDKHFAEPELTVATVARALGVSPRYLQRLFEAAGTSFTAHVTELRLQHALVLLTRSVARQHRICDIALEAGFSDLSHFNRLFRGRFGDTPSGVRTGFHGAQGEDARNA